jgi:CheY-like chemotaxis protein
MFPQKTLSTNDAMRILVIDDEERIQEVIQMSLEILNGWEVFTASSGSQGVQEAQNHQPDAILLDVSMPQLDGFATFAKLQENPATQKIPVIFLTAKVELADRQQFAKLGIVEVITKPFDPLNLAAQVTAALELHP